MTIDAARIARDRALIARFGHMQEFSIEHWSNFAVSALADWPVYIEDVERLQTENARLRQALEQIQMGAASNAGRCMDCNTIQLVAEKALTNSDTDINALFLGGQP